jgi:hypothetical protein
VLLVYRTPLLVSPVHHMPQVHVSRAHVSRVHVLRAHVLRALLPTMHHVCLSDARLLG